MRIAILGAGRLGTALARRLVPQGHNITLSYTRDGDGLRETARLLGAGAGSPVDAVSGAEIVALTVPWGAVPDALDRAGDLGGKIIWDCTNPLRADMGGLQIGTTTSAGEEVARLTPGARVVKGIPPFADLLVTDDVLIDGRAAGVFVAGDDAEARLRVAELLGQLPADVTDAGGLNAARYIEPAMMLLVHLAYVQGFGTSLGLKFQHERGQVAAGGES